LRTGKGAMAMRKPIDDLMDDLMNGLEDSMERIGDKLWRTKAKHGSEKLFPL
jgi:hypothetical protein